MSKKFMSASQPSVWYKRSRWGMWLGALLLAGTVILRWKMGNSAVESSSLNRLHWVAFIWTLIALFVNLWTRPADMFELKPKHDEKDDTKA